MKPEDRADIVDKNFELKLRAFVAYLRDKKPFGNVTAVLYTIEFQKRGLPHCHLLLWLDASSKRETADQIDAVILAEIPNKENDPEGHRVVTEFMIHGPCGLARPVAPCMQDNSCSKSLAKKYQPVTSFNKNGFIQYRRRDASIFIVKHGVQLDNSYVVPYNRELCLVFHAHINVEFCGASMLIKYLFKYISKGVDRIKSRITNSADDNGATSNDQEA